MTFSMALIAVPSLVQRGRLRASPRLAVGAAVLAACAAFLFLDVRTTPLVLWDESRMAVNALEMHLSGRLRLVTTYGLQPDLWNTKPPLLVWLMDLSISAFGPSEWALRLPSAMAALGTLVLVMSWTWRVTRSTAAGALAAVTLATSLIFFGEHGARTADYEALLAFLTTAYLYVLFFALHRRRPGVVRVGAAAALVALAVLTKSVAGLLPGVGVAGYLLLVGRAGRPFRTPAYLVAGALAAAAVAGFFVAREHASPGYLKAAMFNDVSGRFASALDRHEGPPWYYVKYIFVDCAYSVGLFALAGPVALLRARGAARLALLFCLCSASGVLAILSCSATKLLHYAITAAPPVAVMTAVGAHALLRWADRLHAAGRARLLSPVLTRTAVVLVVAIFAVPPVVLRYQWLPRREFYPQAAYGQLFAALQAQGAPAVAVVDGGMVTGVRADGVARDYAPQLDYYRLRARAQGLDVRRIARPDQARGAGSVVATCDPRLAAAVRMRGVALAGLPAGCVAVRPTA